MKATVAIAQFAPAVLSLERSVEKACKIIRDAGKEGARLLAFPETWIPVYPLWVDMGSFSRWGNVAGKTLYARLYNNSLDLKSKHMDRILAASRKSQVHVVLGVNERDARSKTIYNTSIVINDKGEVRGAHRKLVPTFGERLVWGQGDGTGLETHATPFGNIGALICWEHWMPPARQVLHERAETIHVGLWPHGRDLHQLASRHYAFEGRCYVLLAAMFLQRGMFPEDYELADELSQHDETLLPGGSAIIAPDASYVVEPTFDKEKLILAEIDTDSPIAESLTLDVAGHYSRPDVFRLSVTPSSPRHGSE